MEEILLNSIDSRGIEPTMVSSTAWQKKEDTERPHLSDTQEPDRDSRTQAETRDSPSLPPENPSSIQATLSKGDVTS